MIPSLFLLDFPRAYALVSLSPRWLALLSPAPVRACYLQSPCPLLPSLSLCLPQPWSLRSSPLQKWPSFPFSKIKGLFISSLWFLWHFPFFPGYPWFLWHSPFFPGYNFPMSLLGSFLCSTSKCLAIQSSVLNSLHLSLSCEVFFPDVTQWYLPYSDLISS